MCQRFTLEKKWNKDQECATKRETVWVYFIRFTRGDFLIDLVTQEPLEWQVFFNNTAIYMLHVAASRSRGCRALHLILMIIWHCSLCVHSVLIFCISCSSFSSSPSTFKVHTHTHTHTRRHAYQPAFIRRTFHFLQWLPGLHHMPLIRFSWLIAVAEGFPSLFLTFKRALICTSQHFCARLHKGIHTHTHARAWAQTHRLYLLVCVFVQSSVETSCSLVKQLAVIPVHIVHYVGS